MLSIQVCVGSACHLKGSYGVIHSLQLLISEHQLEDKVEVKAAFCLGNCAQAVSVRFEDEELIYSVLPQDVGHFFTDEVLFRI